MIGWPVRHVFVERDGTARNLHLPANIRSGFADGRPPPAAAGPRPRDDRGGRVPVGQRLVPRRRWNRRLRSERVCSVWLVWWARCHRTQRERARRRGPRQASTARCTSCFGNATRRRLNAEPAGTNRQAGPCHRSPGWIGATGHDPLGRMANPSATIDRVTADRSLALLIAVGVLLWLSDAAAQESAVGAAVGLSSRPAGNDDSPYLYPGFGGTGLAGIVFVDAAPTPRISVGGEISLAAAIEETQSQRAPGGFYLLESHHTDTTFLGTVKFALLSSTASGSMPWAAPEWRDVTPSAGVPWCRSRPDRRRFRRRTRSCRTRCSPSQAAPTSWCPGRASRSAAPRAFLRPGHERSNA